MDTTRIEKRIGVRAPSDRIWEILTDLENWHSWNPYETGVTGALAFGGGINLTEALPGMAERQVQARIGDWRPYAQLVWAEKRGWLFNTIRYYEIEELERGNCIVSNGVIFTGLRGELFHDKHRSKIRSAYEDINEALRRAAEG